MAPVIGARSHKPAGQALGVRSPSRPGVVGEFRRGHQFSELLK